MEPLISVIIPVYNAEETLRRCLNSVCSQSYSNLDIIIINDGSTDRSGMICDSCAKRDQRIRAIHQENKGVSVTRNKGIKLAEGDYLTFLDSDDWIEPGLFQYLIDEIRENDSDIIQWSYCIDSADGQCLSIRTPGIRSLKDCNCRDIAGFFSTVGYVWNKMYKAEIINVSSKQFDKNAALYEDMLFNLDLLSGGYEICFTDFIGTHYVQYSKSLGRKRTTANYSLGILCLDRKLSYLRKFDIAEKEIEKYRAREILDLSYNEMKPNDRDYCPSASIVQMIKSKLCNVSVFRLDKKRIIKLFILKLLLLLSRFRRIEC